jgi:DnaJ-class molecular chaperone
MSRVYQDYCNTNYTEADIPRYEVCPTCKGRGLISHPDSPEQEDCEHCAGHGEIESPPTGVWNCGKCRGTVLHAGKPNFCPYCRSTDLREG